MHTFARALAGAALVLAGTSAIAQTATPIVAGAPAAAMIRSGTPIVLRMAEGLTTEGKRLRVGYRFRLVVAEPVVLNGVTVIPAGSPAVGEVNDVRNKGMWGRSGRIGARIVSVQANGRSIRLTGAIDDRGVTGTAGVVGAIAFVPIAGFLVTGTSARIPMDAPVNAFIDEDIPVAFAATAGPAPMVVGAPAVAPAAPAPAPAAAPTLTPVSATTTAPR